MSDKPRDDKACFYCEKPIESGDLAVGFVMWIKKEKKTVLHEDVIDVVFHSECFADTAGEDYYSEVSKRVVRGITNRENKKPIFSK